MARGKSLSAAIDDLRLELSETTNAATGKNTRPKFARAIARTQEVLAEEFDWPFLRIQHHFEVAAGQRYYDFPDNLPFEKIEKAEYRWNGIWLPLAFGIGSAEYNTFDSDLGTRTDPALKWYPYNEGLVNQRQVELWPIPSVNGTFYSDQAHGGAFTEGTGITGNGVVRFTGLRDLNPLVEDDDILDLDDIMVVLYAAAEILADRGKKNADLVLKRAQQRKTVLTKKQGKTGVYRMGGTGRRNARLSRPIVVSARVTQN